MELKENIDVQKLLANQLAGWRFYTRLKALRLPVDTLGIRLFLLLKVKHFVLAMGLSKAIRFMVLLLFSSRERCVELPGYERPIWIRFGTSDPAVFYSIFIDHCYQDISKIDNPNWVLDAGAYTGYSALYFSKHLSKASIVAIEPQRDNYRLLCKNTTHLDNVYSIKAALMPKETNIQMATAEGFDEKSYWGFRTTNAPQSDLETVNGHTFNTIESRFSVKQWDIVKIDIEGGEMGLFENFDLSSARLIFIELHEHFHKGSSDSFFNAVRKFDADVWVREENIVVKPLKSSVGKRQVS